MIPPFSEQGLLPNGIYDCTMDEAAERFGAFQSSDRRPQLWARFAEFMREAKACRLIEAVLVDGSFVTATSDPTILTSSWWCPRTMTLKRTSNQANTTSFPSDWLIGALDSISWLLAPTPRNTVATWGSFNRYAWNRSQKGDTEGRL